MGRGISVGVRPLRMIGKCSKRTPNLLSTRAREPCVLRGPLSKSEVRAGWFSWSTAGGRSAAGGEQVGSKHLTQEQRSRRAGRERTSAVDVLPSRRLELRPRVCRVGVGVEKRRRAAVACASFTKRPSTAPPPRRHDPARGTSLPACSAFSRLYVLRHLPLGVRSGPGRGRPPRSVRGLTTSLSPSSRLAMDRPPRQPQNVILANVLTEKFIKCVSCTPSQAPACGRDEEGWSGVEP